MTRLINNILIEQLRIPLHQTGMFLEEKYFVTPKFLGIESEYFLCECKNHKGTVIGTWVSKFNTIISICVDC